MIQKSEELEKCVLRTSQKTSRRLKKLQSRKMTAMKFVGVIFDPEKFKAGEAEINDALARWL